tara:strand:+ start:432 stop:563 length:132 start_codon:yes stop_codon:yes gene_type:complete
MYIIFLVLVMGPLIIFIRYVPEEMILPLLLFPFQKILLSVCAG